MPHIILSKLIQSHVGSPHINHSSSNQPNLGVNNSQPRTNVVPSIILSQSIYSNISPVHLNESPLPQPNLGINQSQPQPPNIEYQPQSNQYQPINQETKPLTSPPTNRTSAPSASITDKVNDDHQIWIVPEDDG